jgi:hypothetical protein
MYVIRELSVVITINQNQKKVIMTLERPILKRSAKVDSAIESLRASRKLQEDRLAHGSKHVDLYVDDVEGDWLENWDDNEPDEAERPNSVQQLSKV